MRKEPGRRPGPRLLQLLLMRSTVAAKGPHRHARQTDHREHTITRKTEPFGTFFVAQGSLGGFLRLCGLKSDLKAWCGILGVSTTEAFENRRHHQVRCVRAQPARLNLQPEKLTGLPSVPGLNRPMSLICTRPRFVSLPCVWHHLWHNPRHELCLWCPLMCTEPDVQFQLRASRMLVATSAAVATG